MSCECDRLRRQIAEMQAKLQKQKNEIGRLTRLTASLNQEKKDLLFDLNKLRFRMEQRAET